MASGSYLHDQAAGNLLARIDAALAAAENQSGLAWQQADSQNEQQAGGNADWKKLLDGAIQSQRLRLIEFPVAGNAGPAAPPRMSIALEG